MVLKLPATVQSRGVMACSGLGVLLGAWLAPSLAPVPAQAQTGTAPVVRIEGSSTVFPIIEVAAKAFQTRQGGQPVSIALKETGSTGGLRSFCRGEIPISNSSRPINSRELKACAAKGVRFIELPLAFDAISVVVHPRNSWASRISTAELSTLWNRKAQGRIKRWKQVNAAWPDRPIHLCGPGADSGTFDYFNKAINGDSGNSRTDYTSSEDDNVLVRCVEKNPQALGYFGFSYYRSQAGKLKALEVAGPRGAWPPSVSNVQRERYQPLSRPLFVYVNDKDMRDRPEVRRFVTFTVQRGLRFTEQAGAIPLPADTYRIVESKLYRHLLGTSFGGDLPIGLTISQAIRRSFEDIRSKSPR
ncbi:MAG: PstS family phosphate ABC transporter substrate-binding protein [Aphanothece saxicola GSE-SYN-MK-01-06B]|jgi:phosphate transport system substrate-binding protein|nr:PstS family phosphate ABC transporter substrate-binding protein [Aphanothece saxicola GSE-SYN-MK-01-06B]